MYFEAFDLIFNCITDRFDQKGFQVYRKVQDVLLKATRKESYAEDLDFLMDFYKDDFRSDILKAQLKSFAALAHERFAR